MTTKYGDLTTVYRKLADLKKHPSNPRTIKDEQFDNLVKSIKENPEYLIARPILLSDRTGELVIFAGNQRFDAAKIAKLKEVPTILFQNLTEEKEKELMLRDNINNGQWNVDILKEEFADMPFGELGLDLLDEMPLLDMEREVQPPERMQIKPYNKTHVLISFPPEKLIDLQELLEEIKNIDGVEYEQSSN